MSNSGVNLKSRASGFSLLEVLISMLILAFGVMAMGGLQLASMKSAQSATSFSTAATLARDYTEMMRSNTTVSNSTATSAPNNPYLFDSGSTSTYTVTPAVNCKTTVCTASNISVLHVADWAERVAAQLPAGRAVVCRDPAPRNADGSYRWDCGANDATAITIKIGWIDRRDKEERGRTSTISVTPTAPQLVLGGLTGYSE